MNSTPFKKTSDQVSTLDKLIYQENPNERGNCFGFVFKALGLVEKEESIRPTQTEIEKKLFQIVSSAEEADALGLKDITEVGDYKHIALIDPQDRLMLSIDKTTINQ